MPRSRAATGRRDNRSAFASFARAVSVPSLRRVVIAFGLTSAIEASSWLAIGVYAYEQTGAAEVGIAGVVILLPSAVAAPIAAGLADRYRRKRVLVAASIVQAAAVAATAMAVALGAPSYVAYGLAAIACVALTPVRPAQGAFLPSTPLHPPTSRRPTLRCRSLGTWASSAVPSSSGCSWG